MKKCILVLMGILITQQTFAQGTPAQHVSRQRILINQGGIQVVEFADMCG